MKHTKIVKMMMLLLGIAVFMNSGCSKKSNGEISKTITSIQITPVNTTVHKGTTGQYMAIAYFSDNSSADVTTEVQWESSDTRVVAFKNPENPGWATAVGVGSATITAQLDDVVSNNAAVVVTEAKLQRLTVLPSSIEMIVGLTRSLQAKGYYDDGAVEDVTLGAAWKSSDTTVATVTNKGVLNAKGTGTAVITASFGGLNATASLKAVEATLTSITINPSSAKMDIGDKQEYTAVGHFNNGASKDITGEVTWSSSDNSIAQLVHQGNQVYARGVREGNATISAQWQRVVSNESMLTIHDWVLESIEIYPSVPSINVGDTHTYHAKGHYTNGKTLELDDDVTWESENKEVATMDGNVAMGVGAGNTTIHASLGDVVGMTNLYVDAAGNCEKIDFLFLSGDTGPIQVGDKRNYRAIAACAGYEYDVTESPATEWSSSDKNVLSVSSTGVVTGLQAGTSTLKATYRGKETEQPITVIEGE